MNHDVEGEQTEEPTRIPNRHFDMRPTIVVVTIVFAVATLYLARGFFIPLLLGMLASYFLCPIVDRLQRWHLPRAIGAFLVLGIVIGALSWIAVAVSDDVAALIDKLPSTARAIAKSIRAEFGDTHSPLQNMREAAKALQAVTPSTAANGANVMVADRSSLGTWLEHYGLQQGALALSVLVQTPIVLLLVYFLLASGGHFRRKLVQAVGPSLARKKEMVRLLDDVDAQIQYYLFTMVTTNALLGLACWLAFWALDLHQPAAWGIVCGLLHFVPYLGPAFATIACALAGFVQTGSLVFSLEIGGTALALATLTGYGFQTWMQSRMSQVHPAVLFIGVLFFAWLWGVWGFLLGAPIVAIVKVICDHVASLRRAAILLAP